MTRFSGLAMRLYAVQPKNRVFVNGYGFLSFARNMGENVTQNIGKNVSSKYSQKRLHYAKKSARNTLKTASKGAIQ